MRGNKRRVAAVATAAGKAQPALNDAILDVANRKGIRCCVECGATSTPQWREGPMGPKTLCNACGVRRQRMLRKQQVAVVGSAPAAPVAAVQARRRTASRAATQAPMTLADDFQYGAASGSEHSSDETELEWAANPPLYQQQNEVYDSCNEEESAAYDLLFFAGIECGAGSQSSEQVADVEGAVAGWCSQQPHGHNTRRNTHPLRRSDDFYYYCEDALADGVAGTVGTCKRRKVAVPPPRLQIRPLLPGTSFSSTTEDAADSKPYQHPAAAPAAPATSNVTTPARLPAASAGSDSFRHPRHQQLKLESLLGEQPQPPAAPATLVTSATSPTGADAAANAVPPVPVPASTASVSLAPLAPLLTLPLLPLSLPLPSVSAKDIEMLAHLQLEFQRACQQLHTANAACEAVGAVVAERREAAVTAHGQAAAASQQLATEVRSIADRYRLRDVLAELHIAATAGGRGEGAAAPECAAGAERQ